MSNDKIQVKESTRYPGLFVHKYAKKVFYKGLWDDECIESRGRVKDATGKTVICPFTKIFNHMERGTTIPLDEKVLVVDKINGFMAGATYVESVGKVVISTTGSLDSDFVDMAASVIPPSAIEFIEKHGHNMTWLFEIVHKDDPHIISEPLGAYLLGARNVDAENAYHSAPGSERLYDNFAKKMGVLRPAWWFIHTFGEVVEAMKTYDREGAVVYGKNVALKIKTPTYLILKLLARKKDIMSLDKTRVDEEFYELMDACKDYEAFSTMEEQDRLSFMVEFLRKK